MIQIQRHGNTDKDTAKDPKDAVEECKIKLKIQIQLHIQTQIEYDIQMQKQIKLKIYNTTEDNTDTADDINTNTAKVKQQIHKELKLQL